MSKVLMISIKTLKDNYTLDDNIEDKYLLSNIQKGMDFIVRPLLGKKLYNKILLGIENGNLSTENEETLEDIEPILAYFVMSEVVYSTAYKLKNKGLEEGSDSNRFDELVRISKKYKRDSEHYAQILREDLEASCDSKNKSNVYKTGIYLG